MKVEVVKYRSEWTEEFEAEAEKIREILGDETIAIYHIGSTSVEGLSAKPIIDIMPVVKDISRIDKLNSAFESLGYECMGEFGIPGRRYFRKGGEERTHQIHIFGRKNEYDISRHLAVRDYLRRHADKAKEYGRLKEELAKKYPFNIEGYCDGKDSFVKDMEREALKEFYALAYLSRDKNSYVDMSECISRGAAKILFSGDIGVLLYEQSSGIYMIAAEGREAAEKILSFLDEKELKNKSGLLVAHGETARAAAYEKLGLKGETACFQVVYTSKNSRSLKGNLNFRIPERAEIEKIKREYHLESPENIEKLCSAKKIWCGFSKSGDFIGFIGRHPEGSMGLLQVFPEYRRRGYGEELESFMINRFLEEGRVPYAHIIVDNEKSMNLQKKLGYEVADKKIYWLFEE